jgi:hypothetical protein
MAEENSRERDTAARRVRQCSRLKPVSPAPLGEQTGAPPSAGAPVGFSSRGAPPGFWRCRGVAPLGVFYCTKHGEAVPESPTVSVTPETLNIEREEIFELIAGVFANKTGEVFYDARARRGRPRAGILNEGLLMDAINMGLVNDPERRARLDELCRVSRNLTRPEVRELRELLVGAAPAEKLNTKTVAEHYGIKERAARNLVRAANSPLKREVDSMPLTKADMNELREELEERYEALHADVRATLAVVLERFPDSNTVAAAVDEFLDDTLRD